jgi:dihydrofolate reductase
MEESMGSIVVTEFLSLDGVMEAPGGDDNFERGAWTFEFDRGDEGNAFKTGETTEADAMLLGRRTYEAFARAWSSREGDFADTFNNMPKYVVSSTLKDPDWGPTTVLDGDLAAAVAEARDRHERHLIVHGSCQLVQTLIEEDLVDELRLMVFPVVLGYGKRLFGDTSATRPLKLAESNVVGDGVLTLVYRRP